MTRFITGQNAKPLVFSRIVPRAFSLVLYILCLSLSISGCSQIADKLIEIAFTRESVSKPIPQESVAPSQGTPSDRANLEIKPVLIKPSQEQIQQSNERSQTASTDPIEAPTTITQPPVIRYAAPRPHRSQPIDVSGMKNNDW